MQHNEPTHNRNRAAESSTDDIRRAKLVLVSAPNHVGRGRSAYLTLPLLKIAGAGLFALLLFVQISQIGGTISYFSDLQSSIGNTFHADPVDFTVALATLTIDMSAGSQLVVPVFATTTESDPVQYSVASQMTDGDASLCSALQVLGTAPFPYDGPLLSLATGLTTDLGPWALTISLPSNYQNASSTSCSVDLIYSGWNAQAQAGQGFSYTVRVPLTFMAPVESGPPADVQIVDASSTPVSPDASQVGPPTDTATTTPDVAPLDTATTTPDAISPPDQTPPPPADTAQTPPSDTPPPTDVPPADTPVQ